MISTRTGGMQWLASRTGGGDNEDSDPALECFPLT